MLSFLCVSTIPVFHVVWVALAPVFEIMLSFLCVSTIPVFHVVWVALAPFFHVVWVPSSEPNIGLFNMFLFLSLNQRHSSQPQTFFLLYVNAFTDSIKKEKKGKFGFFRFYAFTIFF
jgi:hypothetical protein